MSSFKALPGLGHASQTLPCIVVSIFFSIITVLPSITIITTITITIITFITIIIIITITSKKKGGNSVGTPEEL